MTGEVASGQAGGHVALVGNPRPGSRTAALAVTVLDQLAEVTGPVPRQVVDLGELLGRVGAPLGEGSGDRYAEPLATVLGARLLVVATPTYKGSYTGLLKSFLDHVAAGALHRTVAVPVITVGGPGHTLAADVHLRPLLLELGASTPTRALVVQEKDLDDPVKVVQGWVRENLPALGVLVGEPVLR